MFERPKSDGCRERDFVGVRGPACLEAWAKLMPLLSSLSRFPFPYWKPLMEKLGRSGGGEVKKSNSSHNATLSLSRAFRPFEAPPVRSFDLDEAESLPALDRLLLLFSCSRLATVSERTLGTMGVGAGLPTREGSVSLSARSGRRSKSSVVRGRPLL